MLILQKGFTNLASYDSEKCASKCNAISGCAAFNLYYERDPSKDPGTGCENPTSTTNIKVRHPRYNFSFPERC